jgi:hypothetical protein
MLSWVSGIYREYNETVSAKYQATDKRGSGQLISIRENGIRIAKRSDNLSNVHRHFMNVMAKSMLANIPRVIQPTIDELINTPLPNESTVDTEIRASLRMDAHINANSRFLLALLHTSHADIEVVKRGKLLMQSAADDGSDRAVQWLAAQPQEVQWETVQANASAASSATSATAPAGKKLAESAAPPPYK